MTRQPTPGLHQNFAEEAAMSTDKAMVTDDAKLVSLPLAMMRLAASELREKGGAVANMAAKAIEIEMRHALAHPPAKREAGETPPPESHLRVKPLVWTPEDVLTWTDRDGKEHPSSSYWEAKSPIAGYQVSKFTDERFPKVSRKFCLRIDHSTKEQEFDTLDQAKEAAEVHYRQRVEALLEPQPPVSKTHVDGERKFCDFPECGCSSGAAERCSHPPVLRAMVSDTPSAALEASHE